VTPENVTMQRYTKGTALAQSSYTLFTSYLNADVRACAITHTLTELSLSNWPGGVA